MDFLSMFVQNCKTLKPIYNLTRKDRPFVWGKEQQDSFEEIKHRLFKPPVLHMPNATVRFHSYSDTSKFATGSALYQIENDKPKSNQCMPAKDYQKLQKTIPLLNESYVD